MDPWLTKDQVQETGCKESVVADLENTLSTTNIKEGNSIPISFSDNFQPFQKLPDSGEYLASLETKLKNIQNSEKKTSGDLLRSLEETRESYMVNLLSDSDDIGASAVYEDSFEELKINPVLKKIVPEKQAITTEELVHLLKADQLGSLLSNQGESVDETINTREAAPTEELNSTSQQDSPP